MNILITSNTYYKFDFLSYRGGLETVVGETFKLLFEKFKLDGLNEPFFLCPSDSIIPEEYSNNVIKYSFPCIETTKKVTGKKRIVLSKLEEVDRVNISKLIADKNIKVIFDSNTKPGLVREMCTFGIPVLHNKYGLLDGFEYHTFLNINKIQTQVHNLFISAVSSYTKNNINRAIEDMVDYVIPPYIVGDRVNKNIESTIMLTL